MALLLKSTKIISAVIGFAGRTYLETGRRSLFLECPRFTNFNGLRRTSTSAAAKENIGQNEDNYLEELLYQLNRNINYNNLLLQDINNVLSTIKQKGVMSDPQFAFLLRSLRATFMATDKERIDMANDIWALAEKSGIVFRINHYNALLCLLLENDQNFKPAEFLRLLKQKNIEPNERTYRLILKAYCQKGDINEASKILVKMKESSHPLNEEDFNSLIQGHCEIGDFEKAIQLLEVMKSRDIIPESSTYLTLLLGYAKHGKIEELHSLLAHLPEQNINLRNSDLLEIMYTLAVNNQASHIGSIKERLNKEDPGKHSARIIQRLLHKKMDSLALEIFECSSALQPNEEIILTRAKFIVKHFVQYREPDEVWNICKYLEKKGWTKGAVSYALREILITKEDLVALRFLCSMSNHNLEIRHHYFWPIIINSSKKGKQWMHYILERLPKFLYSDPDTIQKAIFPNYPFTETKDTKFLNDIGISKKFLNFCFVEKELANNNMKEAERLLSLNGIAPIKWRHIINYSISCLLNQPDEKDSFLNAVKHLAVDFFNWKHLEMVKQNRSKGTPDMIKVNNIFDYTVMTLLKRLEDKEMMKYLLEGMLKRKMPISSETAKALRESSFDSEEVRNLATKLVETSFGFDSDLILQKMIGVSHKILKVVSDPVKDLAVKVMYTNTGFQEFQSLGSDVSVIDSLFFANALLNRNEPEKAVEIFESMIRQNADLAVAPEGSTKLITLFFDKLTRYFSEFIRAFELAERTKFLQEVSRSIYTSALSKSNFDFSVRLFCEFATRQEKQDGLMKLLMRAVSLKRQDRVHRILEACSDFLPSNIRATYLAIALATSGAVKEAKEILQSEKVSLGQEKFYRHCKRYYQSSDLRVLKNYLELVKDIKNFDRVPLYKLIIQKCADERNVAEALEICTAIEEENPPAYIILKEIAIFRACPTPESLQEFCSSVDVNTRKKPRFAQSGEYELVVPGRKENHRDLIKQAATRGDLSEVLTLLKEHPVKPALVASSMLHGGHVMEYLELLEHYAAEGKFNEIADCFNFRYIPSILEDDAAFKKYETLAIRCLKEGNVTTPLIDLFVNCLKISSKVPAAEAYATQYSAHFKNIPFRDICEEAIMSGLELRFYRNFIESEGLKTCFAADYYVLYDKLIEITRKNRLMIARDYLEKAISDKVEKNLDKEILRRLAENMNNKGERFPYPELLASS